MSTTFAQGSRKTPFPSALDHAAAAGLAAAEYERMADTLSQLTIEQWSTPTDCTGWDVRDLAGHVLGMTQMASSIKETVRQQLATSRRVKRDGVLPIDALTALQVEEHASLTSAEVVRELRRLGPKAVASRRRTPSFIRNRTMPEVQVVGRQEEWWTLGFLLDTILTRDPFMHRIDIHQATGVLLPPTAEHEGVLVDDIVREWAGRHGAPCTVELSGPAGGHWQFGQHSEAGEQIAMDANEFCRAVSGRAPAPGLLAHQVPF